MSRIAAYTLGVFHGIVFGLVIACVTGWGS